MEMERAVEKEPEIISIFVVVEITFHWAVATKKQIERVRDEYESDDYEKQLVRIADDHFLKIALDHLIKWIKILEKYVSYSKYTRIEDEYDVCLSLEKSLKEKCNGLHDYRNMGEHDIDYYSGIGRKQELFIDQKYHQSRIQPLIKNGDYLVSGQIGLNEIEPVVDKIVEVLRLRQFNFKDIIFDMSREELEKLLEDDVLI